VVLQPFHEEPSAKKNLKGTVAVGRLIDERVAADFARIAGSDVAFVYGGEIVGSTLGPLKEFHLGQHMGSFRDNAAFAGERELLRHFIRPNARAAAIHADFRFEILPRSRSVPAAAEYFAVAPGADGDCCRRRVDLPDFGLGDATAGGAAARCSRVGAR
jgi:hypothetical protein